MNHSTEGMREGDIWAYRRGGRAPLGPVEIIEVGNKKVNVQHLGEGAQGQVEWVPAGRLRCLWTELESFLERERRWDALATEGPSTAAEMYAAETVFLEVVPEEVASLDWGANGRYCTIRNLRELSEMTGVSSAWIAGQDQSFIEDGVLYAPWPVVSKIAQELAPMFALDLLKKIEAEEEREAQTRLERGMTKAQWDDPDVDHDDAWLEKVGRWRRGA